MPLSLLPIIGLEVHIELKTKSKMFCWCSNHHFGAKPNTHTCPICLGFPGALPIPNKKAIENTITLALALNCQINNPFWFDRKNYFYPDLPKGYQITQHLAPIGINGKLPIFIDNTKREITISDIHLEEDTAKLIHSQNKTLIDFNRSGVPLVEIVSSPTIHSTKEAIAYLKRLQLLTRYLGLSDCDMEKGSMRLEANISIIKNPRKNFDLPKYKVEIKNLNSFRFVEKAINYEIERQIKILKEGGTPKQETRGFDSKKGITYSQRTKEMAKDYRYFPEPDIPAFRISSQEIARLKPKKDSLPWAAEEDLLKLGLEKKLVDILINDKNAVAVCKKASLTSNLNIAQIANFIINKKPNLKKTTFKEIIRLVNDNLNKFSASEKEIKDTVLKVVRENLKAVEDFKSGKQAAIGFLIGQVQKKLQGKANPQKTKELLLETIES